MPLIPTQEPPYYQISDSPDVSGEKQYIALLNQTGTSNPTVTILKNTLSGAITWTRTGVGTYEGTLTDGFPTNKTIIRPFGTGRSTWVPMWYDMEIGDTYYSIEYVTDTVTIACYTKAGTPFELGDAISTYKILIDITVYP